MVPSAQSAPPEDEDQTEGAHQKGEVCDQGEHSRHPLRISSIASALLGLHHSQDEQTGDDDATGGDHFRQVADEEQFHPKLSP